MDTNTISEILSSACSCESSEYLYPPYKHVITGNFNFVNNINLRKLFYMGSKHRITSINTLSEAKRSFEEAIEQYIRKLSVKFKIHIERFQDAKLEMLRLLDIKAKRIIENRFNSDSTRINDFRELRGIHDKFIIAPADKAANNLIAICKKYYVMRMCGIQYSD